MSLRFKNHFWLWFVPPDEGRVRKYHLSFRQVFLTGVVLAVASISLTFIASDYIRLQLVRAKEELQQQRLFQQRDVLLQEREQLAEVGRELKDYERELRQRVDALSSVLSSAEKLGAITSSKEIKTSGGLGGAEIDCGFRGEFCKASKATISNMSLSPSSKNLNDTDKAALIAAIEEYTELFSKIPLGIPGNAHLNSRFGMRRSPFSRRHRMHQGVDFAVPYGSEIKSTADGVVLSARWNRTYGQLIDVQHGKNLVTRYAHLSKRLVKEGDRVCRGQVIGISGSSGRSTGPHLHYEIRVRNRPIDPMKFIRLGNQLQEVLS